MYLVSFCAAKRLGTRLQEQGDLNLGLVTRPVAAAWQQLQPPGPDAVAKASISVAGGPLGVVEKADELLPPADTAQASEWGLLSTRPLLASLRGVLCQPGGYLWHAGSLGGCLGCRLQGCWLFALDWADAAKWLYTTPATTCLG